jgi:hypothetical protein
MGNRRTALTDSRISNLKPKPTGYVVPDPGCLGLYVRVMLGGGKSVVALAREPHAKQQVWTTIGRVDNFTIEQTRE